MNNRERATEQIIDFINSREKGLLLTGTQNFEKHRLIMNIINNEFENAKILFRINSMQNITNSSFIGLKRQPKAGEYMKLGNNYYSFDSFNTASTWHKTNDRFDFVICYPLDAICRSKNVDSIKNLYEHKSISKLFLVSWMDRSEYDYSIFRDFYSKHVIYDDMN